MKLTILGNNGPFPAAGSACSGYLLSHAGKNVLLDCGNGVLSNLQKFIRFEELDAIILTHLHSDHISDMNVLKYALQIKRKRGLTDKLMEVYAPKEPYGEYERLDVKDAFILKGIDQDTVLDIGDMRLTFSKMVHPSPDFAVRVECSGRVFVYSGDTSWCESIISFGEGADLMLLDAGLLERDYTDGAVHLTATQCGKVAKQAGAKRLLLTHFWPEYDKSELLAEARLSFPGAETAELLCRYEI